MKTGNVPPIPVSAPVMVSGSVLGPGGVPPFMGLAIAVDTLFTLENYSVIDTNGHYQFGVSPLKGYYVVIFTMSASSVGGYYIHGYMPVGKYIYVGILPVMLDFSLERACDLILETYDMKGAIIPYENYTDQCFATGLNDSAARAVFDKTDKGSGSSPVNVTALVVPIGEPRKLFIQHESPSFGRIVLRADNGGNGYFMSGTDGIVLNMNYEWAKTRYRQLVEAYDDYKSKGYSFSQNVTSLKSQALVELNNAGGSQGSSMAKQADKSLNCTLWASEMLTMERAEQDIQKYRTGKLIVNIKDLAGNPVPLVSAHLNVTQLSHDFDFGVFDNLDEAGLASYSKLRDIGMNYATEGFYWSISEPTQGNFAWNDLNHNVGVVDIKNLSYKLKAHALCYLLDLAIPAYVKSMNYSDLNKTVYTHVNTLAKAYKDYISVWEASNEAHSAGANLGMTRAQMTQIIKTSIKAIRDAVSGAFVTVNSAFDWFGQSRMGSYLFGGDNFTLSIPEYLDYLDSHGVHFDGLEQQMYDGGHSDFTGLWSMDVPTYDMFELSAIADKLNSRGKPVRISEQSVSGSWNGSWENAGYLHEKWSPQAQADFLKLFYTLIFSKENFRAVNWWDIDDTNSFMVSGGLFDKSMKPKQVFYALRDLLKDWTTAIDVSFNGGKPLASTVYAGNYNISLGYDVPGESTKWLNLSGVHIGEQETRELNITVDSDNIIADLEVTTLGVTPAYPYEGDVLSLNSHVCNKGPAEKKNVTVEFYVNGTKIASRCVNLTAGADVLMSASWTSTRGQHNVSVIIDPALSVNDPDRSNNMKCVLVTVKPRVVQVQKPDLSIHQGDITVPAGDIIEGSNVSFSATVTNIGNLTAASARVTFYNGDPGAGGIQIGSKKTITFIPPASGATVTSDKWAVIAPGTHRIYIEISECIPQEWSTSDNIAFHEIYVKQKPVEGADLSVIAIRFSSESPVAGTNVSIRAEVTNSGTLDALNVTVQFKYDSQYLLAEELAANVPAGKTIFVDTVWLAVEGNHRITVTADPDNRITETNELNNDMAKDITVTPKKTEQKPSDSPDIVSYAVFACAAVFIVFAFIAITRWRNK
jgi:GH35 family endo-1,4-beta-xylanase